MNTSGPKDDELLFVCESGGQWQFSKDYLDLAVAESTWFSGQRWGNNTSNNYRIMFIYCISIMVMVKTIIISFSCRKS